MSEPTIQTPQSERTVFLDQPPSCLEFCPEDPDYFVVGTYLLSETKNEDGETVQKKTGSLQLWKLDPVSLQLTHIQTLTIPEAAIFDLHFHPRHRSILAIATSAGTVSLFRVARSNDTGSPVIQHLRTITVREDDRSIPALFLAWVPPERRVLRGEVADGFAVTFSDGKTSVFGIHSGNLEKDEFEEAATFEARESIEVWFAAWGLFRDDNHGDKNIAPFLFTGDDFGSLHTRRFVTISGEDNDDDSTTELLPPVLLDHDDRARHHTAGLTSILPLPLPLVNGAPLLLTGSYDEFLRVYHATRRGEVLADTRLDGGVWRLQFVGAPMESGNTLSFLVLASCMHAGARVLRVTRRSESADEVGEWDIEVLAQFTEHESMNYASGIWRGDEGGAVDSNGKRKLLCVSSSFYDRRVCVSKAEV
ncbi:hypothetical protein VTN00DRAFT_7122 [Thermoascus crustaceus]|uniref:uncharacterized protein n=1 Tax=Thermoascus crustaceus TaxID=5088 RepID=UPI00374446E7